MEGKYGYARGDEESYGMPSVSVLILMRSRLLSRSCLADWRRSGCTNSEVYERSIDQLQILPPMISLRNMQGLGLVRRTRLCR